MIVIIICRFIYTFALNEIMLKSQSRLPMFNVRSERIVQ